MAMPSKTSPLARSIRPLVLPMVLVILLVVALMIRSDYHQYVATEEGGLTTALGIASRDADAYAKLQDEVLLNLKNTTGGTLHVFVGTVGAMQDVGNGVQTVAAPQEVSNLSPHQQTWLIVKGWQNKYVTSTTTYIFLGAVSGMSSKFSDLTFYETPAVPKPFAVYYAAANSSDSNFVPHYDVPETSNAKEVTSDDVIRDESADVNRFKQRVFPKADAFPTSFWSYLATRDPFK